MKKPPVYKFVEVSVVTDENLEQVVNEWVGQGWLLDGIHFVANESSRRPKMAFVALVTEPAADSTEPAADSTEPAADSTEPAADSTE